MSASAGEQPFFSRVAAAAAATLYERPVAPGAGGWFAFVAFAAPPQPDTLSFAESWSNYLGNPRLGDNGGLYVVAASRPADPAAYLAAFIRAVQKLNTQTGGFAYRYLLVGDPTSGDPTACPGVIPFFTTSPDQPGQISSDATVAARNVGLVLAQGVQLYADAGTSSLRFASFGGALISLLSNKYASKNITTLTSDVLFPLDGAAAGAFGFGVTLLYSNVPANDDFTLLDVGLKYFTERGGRILSQRYPVFGPTVDGSPVPFAVSFDPLRPLARGRTAFTFAGDGSTCVPMRSALRDTFVHGVNIVPAAGASALVLQQDIVTVNAPGDAQHDFYYLVPSGPFALAAGDSQPPATRVMCGLSPLESVLFDPPGSVLTFHPDQPAFSPLLAGASAAQGTPRLTDRYLTAWATITARGGGTTGPAPTYLAQPQGSALYAAGGSPTTYLEHSEVPACVLVDASAAGSFPMVGYGAVAFGTHPDTFSQDDVARLESDAVSVERRARLTAHGRLPTPESPSGLPGVPPPRVTTPQGFVVDLATDGSGAWKRLHLAQTSWSPDPAKVPPTVTTLAFDDVDDTLRAAFQTNQQFLVVTQPRVPWTIGGPAGGGAAGTVFEDELAPQGWPFNVRVGVGSNPDDFRNVLIFKFCDGSLDSRIDDAARWTAAADFNADPDSVATWLRAYVENAKSLARGPDGAYFRRFVDAVESEAWRGILALRVDVDASALPQELRGLVAGIDLTQFNAHHVGVDISFVDTSGGGFKPDGNSSVFATVYYVDPVYAGNLAAGAPPDLPIPVAAPVDYAFRVLTLKTLFVNAEIAAFSSKSQITLNRVFGEQVGALTLDGVAAPSNSLVLDGQYQNHDGVGTYVFQTNADARFLPLSNLWRGFEIVRASFATLRAPAAGTVLSRFTFSGFLDFAVLETYDGTTRAPFDLLSFGGDGAGVDPRGTGLPFSELHLDMTFDTASPGSPSFAFLIDQMTFAPTVQQSRPASFYARMPLTLTGITSGTGTPRDLGYLPVIVPSLPGDPLGDAWYALVYTLDLGTAGALAAKVGFTARLLVAWGPGSAEPSFRVSVGLALPGTGGGNAGAISLQSVLKLTIDRILLYRDPASSTFVLRLTNLALSLLGVSLPPGTSTAFIVYGNPTPGQRDVVGWYAAVNREKKPELPAPTGER